MSGNRITLEPGTRFGQWTVLRRAEHWTPKKTRWTCQCDCGSVSDILTNTLRTGKSLSCGCTRWKHGLTYAVPEYRVWSSMRTRCLNPLDPAYPNYGGRGITVCPKWASFAQFYADMGPRPSAKHSLDRINNSLGYTKANCRWATWGEQQRNRRTNVLLTHEGRTMTLIEWSESTGIRSDTIQWRLKAGWPLDHALQQRPSPIHRKWRAID